MPRFVVVFDGPVTYLPDHPKAQREIPTVEGLPVSAPDAQSAMLHATRTTRGSFGPCAVYNGDGELVWGRGPAEIVIPPPAPPLVESSIGETTQVFSA